MILLKWSYMQSILETNGQIQPTLFGITPLFEFSQQINEIDNQFDDRDMKKWTDAIERRKKRRRERAERGDREREGEQNDARGRAAVCGSVNGC